MAVVPFSLSSLPPLARSRMAVPSLSALLAPLNALIAFFVPAPAAQPHFRPAAHYRMLRTSPQIASLVQLPPTTSVLPATSRLKVVREYDPGMARSQTGRMAISGSMADVCAELDRIAANDPAK